MTPGDGSNFFEKLYIWEGVTHSPYMTSLGFAGLAEYFFPPIFHHLWHLPYTTPLPYMTSEGSGRPKGGQGGQYEGRGMGCTKP